MTTPDPAALREALDRIDAETRPRSNFTAERDLLLYDDLRTENAAARWALEQIEWEGEHCDDCGRAYPDVYSLPDHLWARIHERAPGGLLCPTCALARVAEQIEGGREVWWCEVHDCESIEQIAPGQLYFYQKFMPDPLGRQPDCNMVRRLLVTP